MDLYKNLRMGIAALGIMLSPVESLAQDNVSLDRKLSEIADYVVNNYKTNSGVRNLWNVYSNTLIGQDGVVTLKFIDEPCQSHLNKKLKILMSKDSNLRFIRIYFRCHSY